MKPLTAPVVDLDALLAMPVWDTGKEPVPAPAIQRDKSMSTRGVIVGSNSMTWSMVPWKPTKGWRSASACNNCPATAADNVDIATAAWTIQATVPTPRRLELREPVLDNVRVTSGAPPQ